MKKGRKVSNLNGLTCNFNDTSISLSRDVVDLVRMHVGSKQQLRMLLAKDSEGKTYVGLCVARLPDSYSVNSNGPTASVNIGKKQRVMNGYKQDGQCKLRNRVEIDGVHWFQTLFDAELQTLSEKLSASETK